MSIKKKSFEKKLLITTIILGALLPISALGLSLISEIFLILGIFCGISALFCFIIYLDLKEGKKPKLIPIGLGMAFFGFIFLGVSDSNHQIVNIALSALYAVAGLFTAAMGIKDRLDTKRNRAHKVKRPLNKKIYIGIGLLVGGYSAAIILFTVFPLLMAIGHVMVVVGFVFLGQGISERKNGSRGTQHINNGHATNVQIEYCARCGKNISNVEAAEVFIIDGNKYCSDCNTAIEQDIKNQHTICSICGVDLPIENMHVIDDTLLCHSCFLKKYGNIDSYYEEEIGLIIEDAVKVLRNQIITEIAKKPAFKYQLASLLWQDAANCFPRNGFQWDGAWFELDLKTGKLSARVSTYPNQFGACYEDAFSLSASEFNNIAKQFNMSKELQAFKSDEDWEKLFDDTLKEAISSSGAKLQKKDKERHNKEIENYAIKVPVKYSKCSPDMYISEISIEISQRYSSRNIKVLNNDGNYQVVYNKNSHLSSDLDRFTRTLSVAEAVWLEKRVENTINNPDDSTWQSLPGGDTMNIIIKRNKGNVISFNGVKPIRKYSDLQDELENLAQYGSLSTI